MTKKIKLLSLLVFVITLLFGCTSFENESYFEPTKTKSYLLNSNKIENNTNDEEAIFLLNETYDIPSPNINPISFSSFDGNSTATINGVFIGDLSSINTNTIILYCHDKSGNIDDYWARIKLLAKLGLDQFGILIIDYRGYGKSTGQTTETSLTADTAAAITWLESKGVTDDRLILYGYGLGSVPAIELSANPKLLTPSKIIIEAPIASMELLLQNEIHQAIPGQYFSSLTFNNVDTMKYVTQPLLWFHGSRDEVYSQQHGQLVFNAHSGIESEDKIKFIAKNAGHDNIPLFMSTNSSDSLDQYLLNIQIFLENF